MYVINPKRAPNFTGRSSYESVIFQINTNLLSIKEQVLIKY